MIIDTEPALSEYAQALGKRRPITVEGKTREEHIQDGWTVDNLEYWIAHYERLCNQQDQIVRLKRILRLIQHGV